MSSAADSFDLSRFIDAQRRDYAGLTWLVMRRRKDI
jgi:hypothetical protein